MSRWETEVEIGLSLHVRLSNTALYNFIQRISYTYIEHERAVPDSLRLDVSHYFVEFIEGRELRKMEKKAKVSRNLEVLI